MTNVLVVNSGSSSLKYQLLAMADGTGTRLARGLVERIGDHGSRLVHEVVSADGGEPQRLVVDQPLADHEAALRLVLSCFGEHGPSLDRLAGVGHRIVHGGERFREPVLVDDAVEHAIEELVPLAPLHNPPNLLGLRALRSLMPDVPHVAVFDTAFHSTLPPRAFTYALPRHLAETFGLRRYGFHGTSVKYVTGRAAEMIHVPVPQVSLVVCHVGNGVSVTAVDAGSSVDTSMGLSPLEGLVMGTRSGDIDPAIVNHLVRNAGMSADEVEAVLNRTSGLLGLCGESDMRSVRSRAAEGDDAARLALAVYAYRLRKYIGAYLAVLPSCQAVVFTAGVGENDAELRADVVAGLTHLGVGALDPALNAGAVGSPVPRRIDDATGKIAVLVVPTDEESEIAAQTLAVAGTP